LDGVDEVAASGMDPQVGLAGRCAHEDLDLVEALEDAMQRPAVGDPLAEGAGPDAVPVRAGGVEVDAIDAALTELIGVLLDGLGVVVGGLIDGVVIAEDGDDPSDAARCGAVALAYLEEEGADVSGHPAVDGQSDGLAGDVFGLLHHVAGLAETGESGGRRGV